MKKFLLIICIALFSIHCGSKEDESSVSADNILLYDMGDTLAQQHIPSSIQNWFTYYKQIDKGFTLGNFKASGVNLHIADLPKAISKGNEAAFNAIHFYSTDKKKYLDLFSYNYMLDKGKYVAGEIDQQVVLVDQQNGSKKQLMYYGPTQWAEAAGWLNDHSFLLAVSSKTDDDKHIRSELFLFNLTDSLYTNFQLDHLLDRNVLSKQPVRYVESYLNHQKH